MIRPGACEIDAAGELTNDTDEKAGDDTGPGELTAGDADDTGAGELIAGDDAAPELRGDEITGEVDDVIDGDPSELAAAGLDEITNDDGETIAEVNDEIDAAGKLAELVVGLTTIDAGELGIDETILDTLGAGLDAAETTSDDGSDKAPDETDETARLDAGELTAGDDSRLTIDVAEAAGDDRDAPGELVATLDTLGELGRELGLLNRDTVIDGLDVRELVNDEPGTLGELAAEIDDARLDEALADAAGEARDDGKELTRELDDESSELGELAAGLDVRGLTNDDGLDTCGLIAELGELDGDGLDVRELVNDETLDDGLDAIAGELVGLEAIAELGDDGRLDGDDGRELGLDELDGDELLDDGNSSASRPACGFDASGACPSMDLV